MALLVSLAQEFIAAACWHGSEIHIRGLKSRIAVTSLFIEMAGDIPFHSVLYGEQYRGSSKKQKTKNYHMIQQSTYEYISKGNEIRISKRHLLSQIHGNIVHNSQDVKTTQVSIEG